ncbi:MAG TPA: hypothetical protein PLI09_07290, partial [Candidatus Hydrogenedentes bacterium]|nr:hypothetical protein [Candidatus Hydrogenedentota bacterium]
MCLFQRKAANIVFCILAISMPPVYGQLESNQCANTQTVTSTELAILDLFGTGKSTGEIVSGETVTGTLYEGGSDSYTFSGQMGQGVHIEMAETQQTSGVFEPEIRLYRPAGTQADYNFGDPLTDLDFALDQTGTWTIVASSEQVGAGSYGLSLVVMPGPTTSPQDLDGGAIQSGETLTGTVSPMGDSDACSFYGTTGQGVHIEMAKTQQTSGVFEPEIRLYRPAGTRADYNFGNPLTDLDLMLDQTGTWTIVASSEQAGTGSYGLSLVVIPGPTTSPQDLDGGAIQSGETLTGTVSPMGDSDACSFYGTTGQGVHIEMAKTQQTSGVFEPEIRLYRPAGTQADYNFGDPLTDLDFALDQTGTWTIVASSEQVGTGDYSLSMSLLPPLGVPGILNPYPVDQSEICDMTGSFSWDAVSGATGYDLYFGKNIAEPPQLIYANLLQPSAAFPELELGTTYYWYVVAHTSGDDIPGPYWWFTIQDTPCEGEGD